MDVKESDITAIRDLISTGDLSLAERRKVFERIRGRATTLNDTQLIKAVAATDDGDDDLFCTNVCLIEDEQPKQVA